ncbi:MAG: hypothetical protein IKF65_09175 [Clostridia bacterium]|nr:hypothetical protein [Clostridia bacterium]
MNPYPKQVRTTKKRVFAADSPRCSDRSSLRRSPIVFLRAGMHATQGEMHFLPVILRSDGDAREARDGTYVTKRSAVDGDAREARDGTYVTKRSAVDGDEESRNAVVLIRSEILRQSLRMTSAVVLFRSEILRQSLRMTSAVVLFRSEILRQSLRMTSAVVLFRSEILHFVQDDKRGVALCLRTTKKRTENRFLQRPARMLSEAAFSS